MFNHILVALDGSGCSDKALNLATCTSHSGSWMPHKEVRVLPSPDQVQAAPSTPSVIYTTGSLGEWAAGCGPHESENCTGGLAVKSWTDTKITVSGFTGQYGYGYFVLNPGYKVQVDVFNPQTLKGPAKSKSIKVH